MRGNQHGLAENSDLQRLKYKSAVQAPRRNLLEVSETCTENFTLRALTHKGYQNSPNIVLLL
jgi:hypothetical protein